MSRIICPIVNLQKGFHRESNALKPKLQTWNAKNPAKWGMEGWRKCYVKFPQRLVCPDRFCVTQQRHLHPLLAIHQSARLDTNSGRGSPFRTKHPPRRRFMAMRKPARQPLWLEHLSMRPSNPGYRLPLRNPQLRRPIGLPRLIGDPL